MGGALMTHSESDKILYHGDISDNMVSMAEKTVIRKQGDMNVYWKRYSAQMSERRTSCLVATARSSLVSIIS